ncbi:hypothetical protein R3P38DRAFT_2802228 [Favolaschia claudopus]|uniref:Uncharacterized protein n=1 Tax=Favolaschia claudopus TaxID=2862362 RepID=A0AAV9ZUJ5_9AGAR
MPSSITVNLLLSLRSLDCEELGTRPAGETYHQGSFILDDRKRENSKSRLHLRPTEFPFLSEHEDPRKMTHGNETQTETLQGVKENPRYPRRLGEGWESEGPVSEYPFVQHTGTVQARVRKLAQRLSSSRPKQDRTPVKALQYPAFAISGWSGYSVNHRTDRALHHIENIGAAVDRYAILAIASLRRLFSFMAVLERNASDIFTWFLSPARAAQKLKIRFKEKHPWFNICPFERVWYGIRTKTRNGVIVGDVEHDSIIPSSGLPS